MNTPEECPGLGALTYRLTKAQEKKLQKAVDKVEDICKELVIPGMCVVQYGNGKRRFQTITFSNRVPPKADMLVDLLIRLETLFFDHEVSNEDAWNLWDLVDELSEKYKDVPHG